MTPQPDKICIDCGKLCYGTNCRKCFLKKHKHKGRGGVHKAHSRRRKLNDND